MANRLPSNVIQFAAGDTSVFDMFTDYWNQYRSENGDKKYNFSTVDASGKAISFAEKELALNAKIRAEISKRSGVEFGINTPVEQVANHPLVVWAATNLVSQMIEAVLPDTIIDSIGPYTEVRNLGWGESAVFQVNSRDLFRVSRSGRMGMKSAEQQREAYGMITLNPEQREITVGVSLFRLLCGMDSLARLTTKALRSIETEMTRDAYDAMATAMAALSTTATTGLRVVGYTQADLVKLAQKVSAFSGGAKPVVLGTKVALSQILPDDANYRYDVESPYIKLGYMRTIAGIDVLELPQVANWNSPFSTYLSDSKLWVVAPGQDKILKMVIGGMMSNTTGTFDAATLTQETTFYKLWKVGVVTSSLAAEISLA